MPADDDPASERINQAIGEAIRNGELGAETAGMPAQWVLIGNYYDSDGDICTAFVTNNGSRLHETLGLLALGQAAYAEEARRWVTGPEDDE